MRLTKIRLAGFKSFVDPTAISLPGNLTGVVGPNGSGKSNIIDAVRWVMGELSARHLRGDSMADVVFNGSVGRKPVGTASVELIFDNSDGKIGGPYAGYNEVSLKRAVSRDGTSNYFINGARCRRKDITHLFLGTGLGSRSYAIIEQGMISRVIDAKPDEMRAVVEEAAGISRYKERRRETEARIAEARENLERLQDLRDEVDKQIRHLQRQAATARRYQALKEEERRSQAELLALKLRDLDGGAEVHDANMRERELALQAALAELRAVEAALEKQRAFHVERGEQLAAVQGRYFEVGAELTRTEQSIAHTRELRERQRSDLAQTQAGLTELIGQIERDERELTAVRAELQRLAPELADAQQREHTAVHGSSEAEAALSEWQQRWEEFNRALGAANQTTQVERARIEQLDSQMLRLTARTDRLAIEREQLSAQEASEPLAELAEREAIARAASEQLACAHSAQIEQVQVLRAEQLAVEARLESARSERDRARAELVSLEALQKAALSRGAGDAGQWVARELAGRSRMAESLEVESGWERAVETALGDYLEAVCVERLDDLVQSLAGLAAGRLTLIETPQDSGHASRAAGTTLAAKILQGPPAALRRLARVRVAESFAAALAQRASLADGESVISRTGEWIGRDWLRVARGQDEHSGVIEREHRLKAERTQFASCEQRVQEFESHLASVRQGLTAAEVERDRLQAGIQGAHREHADLLAQLEATRARSQESTLRRSRLHEESAEAAREAGAAQETLARARLTLERGLNELSELDARRYELEAERDERRERLAAARAHAQSVQLAARDLLIRSESRRSTEQSMATGLARMHEQRAQLHSRRGELEQELASGDAPIRELEVRLNEFAARRLEVESELAAARGALEAADSELRSLDERRLTAERRTSEARESMEQTRLAAQETRVRRESIAEQFAQTQCDLETIRQGLAPDASVPQWEQRLSRLGEQLVSLGSVNLAAIEELKEQSERKEYLDRQYGDVSDALSTLDEAMKRIDRETRTRFDETFERINTGLKEKFPRLFGGGHAYLELVGEDSLAAGVAVMARPPGKRNSTIHLLSGGEKALTAVALTFSIFDLNPAPFCILDEVDAPLDEYNVGRFCDIVREMSARVQFIFVTHNKATMELASQLIGVTMNEPGVSRLVAVDVDEAVRLAAV